MTNNKPNLNKFAFCRASRALSRTMYDLKSLLSISISRLTSEFFIPNPDKDDPHNLTLHSKLKEYFLTNKIMNFFSENNSQDTRVSLPKY